MAAIIIISALPLERTDVGKLRPVETVMMYKNGQNIVIETDTDDIGIGIDVASAFENLKASAPAIIYLDTANFLLVSENVTDQVEQLRQVLKHNVEIYQFEGEVNPRMASEFLSVHGGGMKLKHWKQGAQLLTVEARNDRLILS